MEPAMNRTAVGFDPAIHELWSAIKDVDARVKPAHDGIGNACDDSGQIESALVDSAPECAHFEHAEVGGKRCTG
jgi:hypothetical protein